MTPEHDGEPELEDAPAQRDPIDGLLMACLEKPERSRTAALEAVCHEHPAQADTLRRRFAFLARVGLIEEPPDATRSQIPARAMQRSSIEISSRTF